MRYLTYVSLLFIQNTSDSNESGQDAEHPTIGHDHLDRFFVALHPLFQFTHTAALMALGVISAAQQIGVSPCPFAMTVAVAASAAFVTPVSSLVNTLVMAPGGYRFNDCVRVGLPLMLILLVITVLVVPWLLPW